MVIAGNTPSPSDTPRPAAAPPPSPAPEPSPRPQDPPEPPEPESTSEGRVRYETEDGNTVEIHPSDVHLYNLAEEADEPDAAERNLVNYTLDDGETVEIDPSDAHLYNLAEEAEQDAATENYVEVTTPDGETVMVHPSDVHLYNLAPEEPEPGPYGPDLGVGTVTVEEWNAGTAGTADSSLETILRNRGFSLEEIYATNENGQTLIDEVAQVNGLEDPNLILTGQGLTVPLNYNPADYPDVVVNEPPPF